MLKKKMQWKREDLLTGFLYAMEYLMKILFFYGAGALMYGFWQGVTGGYLTLFAGMVISGSMIFRILLMIFEKNKEVTETALLFQLICDGILFTLLSFRMNGTIGLIVLAGCVLMIVVYRFLKGDLRNIVVKICAYCFSMLVCILTMRLFAKGTITFSDSMALLSGSVFFGLDCMKERRKNGLFLAKDNRKRQILPAILLVGKDAFLMGAFGCLTPLFYQILNAHKEIRQISGYRNMIICAGLALFFVIICGNIKKKRASSVFPDTCALSVTVLCSSVFLMHVSLLIGLVYLLGYAAVLAGMFLLKSSGHDSLFSMRLVLFLFSYVFLLLVMFTSFQIYDGIYVDYTVVLMTYFFNMTEVILLEEISDGLIEAESEA